MDISGVLLYHTKEYKGTTTNAIGKTVFLNYIIPKNIRELQPEAEYNALETNYIIPKNIRELQQTFHGVNMNFHYIIPKNIRELQLKTEKFEKEKIISYQRI